MKAFWTVIIHPNTTLSCSVFFQEIPDLWYLGKENVDNGMGGEQEMIRKCNWIFTTDKIENTFFIDIFQYSPVPIIHDSKDMIVWNN